MGRLSEYDQAEQQYLRQVKSQLPEPLVIVGQAPSELRWEDLSEKERRFFVKLEFVLSAPAKTDSEREGIPL